MKLKIPNGARVWKQLDDIVVPNLSLNTIDRAVYSYLLRHSRLEGKCRLCFSLLWLARGVRLCHNTARTSVHRLVARGALRLIERSRAGHVVEILLPEEIPATGPNPCKGGMRLRSQKVPPTIEQLDFFRTVSLRKAIYARERGSCFYCLRRLHRGVQCLDHVVAQMRSGGNSYRNLVSCCLECNSRKAQTSAADFLCRLYGERRLTSRQLTARLHALEALAAGRLRPPLPRFDQMPRFRL